MLLRRPGVTYEALREGFAWHIPARFNMGAACADRGRDVAELDKILLTGFTPDRARPLESLDAFVDFAGRHAELGFTDLVIHWPIPDSDFAADEKVFEQIAMEAAAQLQ